MYTSKELTCIETTGNQFVNIRHLRLERNWVELTFAKTCGTVTREKGKKLANRDLKI